MGDRGGGGEEGGKEGGREGGIEEGPTGGRQEELLARRDGEREDGKRNVLIPQGIVEGHIHLLEGEAIDVAEESHVPRGDDQEGRRG